MDGFIRAEMLLGSDAMQALGQAHIAVFGIGGVGSWACEAVARAGVGRITAVDCDRVDISNINRQSVALRSTVGMYKTEVLRERLRDINPEIAVDIITGRYTAADRERFFTYNYDYVIDAIDSVTDKLDLIETAISRGIPVISSMGTGNKLDPTQFQVGDISKTSVCPLARVMRRELKKRGINRLRVLYSTELPLAPIRGEAAEGAKQPPGSVSWVPPVAGFILAGEAVKGIIANATAD